MSIEHDVSIFYAYINKWFTGRIMSSEELEIAKQAFKAKEIDYVDLILALEEGVGLEELCDNLEEIVTEYEEQGEE